MTENMGTTLLSDTKEIIHTFDSFTNKDQKSCAVFIWTEIVKSLNKIEGKEPGIDGYVFTVVTDQSSPPTLLIPTN